MPRWARLQAASPSMRPPAKVIFPEGDLPRVGRDRVVDQVEDGGLARAVRSDEPGDRALRHHEGAAVDGAQPTALLDQPGNLEQRPAGPLPRRRRGPLRERLQAAARADPRSDEAGLAL